ncbi:phage holin family protein [Flavobacterium wongokense]|uniref:phage holin family protein n=1 Tax=Flavobacterium wongokense TaxID=2910674 RepID=UPI001F17CA2B|nr:phage holin family protein [Flavobacterium sp. WG47]MCF6131960.1 phage holin family protein [Flavobacterium sp. WG47]
MQLNEKLEALTDSLKEYADTNYELIKLEVIDHSSTIISGIVTTLIITVVLVLFAFFGSMYLAYYLSDLLDIDYIGFAIIGGFYLLLAIIIYINKKSMIEKPVCDSFIGKRMTVKPESTTE